MKRDGALESLWQVTTNNFTPKHTTIPNETFDVVIVGAGITGITTGLQLQKAGKKVLIAEAHTIGFGTTGGTTAHINTFMDNPYSQIISDFGEDGAKLVAQSIKDAIALIYSNVQEYAIDCDYEQSEAYLFSQDEKQTKQLNEIKEATLKVGVAINDVDSIPATIEFEKAVVLPGQAGFHPTKYIQALAKVFESLGGVLLENCRITEVKEETPLEISSSLGVIKGLNLIYATHLPAGLNLIHFRAHPYRSYAVAAKLENDAAYPTSFLYDLYDPYHYIRTQEIGGEKYLIVGGEDHKTGHEENTEAPFLKLEAYTKKYFPVQSFAYRWSSQYYEPTDGLPYIGHMPGNPDNVFCATGYSGNGMMYSHVAAITLTDIIVNGDSQYKQVYNPNRLKPVAGFVEFVKEGADITAQYVKAILPADKIETLAELAPGEGRMVKYEGNKVALYKEESGKIHALNPTCPHAKCQVAWNGAEKSWDCPCHGARYSFTGEMLTGPARKDLEVIEIQ
jgi:glycine/D-amino acid oxidase-like deaminating enzyme/nitrite reductase/ring-hydroxylating ferredoxin subunit